MTARGFDTTANLTPSEEFILNIRQQKLHVRSLIPSDVKPRCLLIYLHCYTLHSNTPVFEQFGLELVRKNIAIVSLDFQGHGYSEGERGVINDFNEFVDDVLQLITCLYMGTAATSLPFHLTKSDFVCPFLIVGESLGGGIALASALRMQSSPSNISSKFLGAVLLSPAIGARRMPLLFTAMTVFSYLFGSFPIATSSVAPPEYNWKDVTLSKYLDSQRCPTVTLNSINQILRLSNHVQKSLDMVAFPFFVLHDPQDQLVSVQGSLRLMEKSRTAIEEKEFISIPEGRHDLFHNCLPVVVEHVLRFIDKFSIDP